MENAETILVIILSTFLAIFLALGIILLVKAIKVVNKLRRIADKAEAVVDKADSVGELLKKAATSFSVGKIMSHFASNLVKRNKKSGRRGN